MTHRWPVGPLVFRVPAPRPLDWHAPSERGRAGGARGDDVHIDVVAGPPAPRDGAPISLVTAVVEGTCIKVARAGGFIAALDVAARRATYQGLVDVVEGTRTCPVFESFLRVATSSLLQREGGALLHGASAAFTSASASLGASGAIAFCGLSGAGKTTLVEGCDDDAFLSDDQTILSRAADGHASIDKQGCARFMAWGSPFAGMSARRGQHCAHPLRALVLLSSTRPTRTSLVRRHDHAGVVAELVRHVCSFEHDAGEATRTLAFAAELVATTAVFSLARHIDTSLDDIADAVFHQVMDGGTITARARSAA